MILVVKSTFRHLCLNYNMPLAFRTLFCVSSNDQPLPYYAFTDKSGKENRLTMKSNLQNKTSPKMKSV